MATTAGALSLISVASTTASVSSAVATGGATPPYTYQWYRSTVTGFTPGGGNIISGATALLLNDSGLTPGTQYFYKMVSTDTSSPTVSATSTQLNVGSSQPVLDPNQFTETGFLGTTDLRFNGNTVAVEIDASQSGSLYAGQAVKIVDSADGIPKVVGCAANSDNVMGFINFDIKSKVFSAGSKCEISMAGNCIYLYATTAIARGAQVTLALGTNGGVASKNSGDNIVGWAYDKASAIGQLIRVMLVTPSYLTA
jgi:hypothetical protein